MMYFLEFAFSGFFKFVGLTILLCIVCQTLIAIAAIIKGK